MTKVSVNVFRTNELVRLIGLEHMVGWLPRVKTPLLPSPDDLLLVR